MQTAPLSGPTYETHVIRYRDLIIRKAIPTKGVAEHFAKNIRDVFTEFAENIPQQHIIDTINVGAPTMLVNGLPFDEGLAQPLIDGYDEFPKAVFSDNGSNVLQGLNSQTPFSILNPRSVAFLKQYQYGLVTAIVDEQKAIISAAILDGFTRGLGGREAAKLFRGQIGLTTRQAGALRKFAERQSMLGVRPDVASRRVARYEARLHKYRADRIARTELNRASNAGAIEGYRQAADLGMIDRKKTKKHWLSYLDNRTSDYCESNDGQVAFLDEPFEEGFDYPPAHPHCRSTVWVEYVLIDPKAVTPNEDETGLERYVRAPRTNLDQWKDSKAFKEYKANGNSFKNFGRVDGQGDGVMHRLYSEQGFDGQPTVINSIQMEAREAAGQRIMYRGVAEAQFYDDYMYGQYYSGRGVLGNGTYNAAQTMPGKESLRWGNAISQNPDMLSMSKKQAMRTGTSYAGTHEQGMMKMSTVDGANIITHKEIRDIRDKLLDEVLDEMISVDRERSIEFLQFLQKEILNDTGRTATALGYDGYVEVDSLYTVMQNRTATLVQRELYQFAEEGLF